MKICFVVEFYPPHIGGGEIFMQKIAEGLACGGTQCIVITSRTDGNIPRIEKKDNLKIIRIRVPSFMSRFWFTLLAIFKIVSLARDCDLIHGASYGGALPSFLSAKFLRKKCVLMVYEFMGGLWKNLEPNWLASCAYQIAERMIAHLPFDQFVAISLYTRNCLRLFGIPDQKLEIVYGGENAEILQSRKVGGVTRKELDFSIDDFIYLIYGRAGISKGVEFMVDAVPFVLKKISSAKFVFILTKSGDRTWRQIMHKFGRLPDSSYRLLPGMSREELSDYLNMADCIVIPSLSEGFGLAAVEACTLKKRVVATDAGSLPEVVSGEYVLVKPGSPEALAEGCCRAFAGDVIYSPQKVFRWEESVNRCHQIYREILGL
jgi:glycosyltransferase involved in cell wall biosynthesis